MVALLANHTGDAFAFRTDNNGGRNGEVEIIHGLAAHIGSKDEDALFLQLFDAGLQIGNLGDGHILQRTGSSLSTGSIEAGAAALGNDDAVSTDDLCGTDNRTQVVGIGNTVADEQQGLLAALLGQTEDIFYSRVAGSCTQSNDALMGAGDRQAIQLVLIGLLGLNAHLTGAGDQIADGLMRTGRKHDLVDGASALQCLFDGILALEDQLALFLAAVITAGRSVVAALIAVGTLMIVAETTAAALAVILLVVAFVAKVLLIIIIVHVEPLFSGGQIGRSYK